MSVEKLIKELEKLTKNRPNDFQAGFVSGYKRGVEEQPKLPLKALLAKEYRKGYKAGNAKGLNHSNKVINEALEASRRANERLTEANGKLQGRVNALTKANKALKKKVK